jgi:hypothetical protein
VSENYPNHDGIFAQMYNADGTTRGLEFMVDIAGIDLDSHVYLDSAGIDSDPETYIHPGSHNPAIAALIDGGFAIAWVRGEELAGIWVQMYNADGITQGSGSEFKVFGVEYYAPSITSLIGGGFVVTAVVGGGSIAANANLDAYIAQIYNADGTPQGAEIQLGTTFITNATTSDRPIVALTDGGFVVALESSDLGGQDYKLSAQIYNADGSIRSAEFQINTTSKGYLIDAELSIAALADGSFVFAWLSHTPSLPPYSGFIDVVARIYNAEGEPQGLEFAVSHDGGFYPSISTLLDGGFVVTWHGTSDIYAQRYDVDANPIDVIISVPPADAIIHTVDDQLLDNITLHYIKDGIDTGVSTLVEQGGINIEQNIEFDSITLSVNDAYADDLNIMDMYGVLGNIGQIIDTSVEHAADTNNDGIINIMDMYAVLNSIGQTSQSFDLVDQNGNLVTSLNSNSVDTANWNIIANGDVDQSGGFVDAYVMQVDIV